MIKITYVNNVIAAVNLENVMKEVQNTTAHNVIVYFIMII